VNREKSTSSIVMTALWNCMTIFFFLFFFFFFLLLLLLLLLFWNKSQDNTFLTVTNYTEQSPFWGDKFLTQSRNFPHSMEPKSSLPHSQAPATCPHPEAQQCSAWLSIHFLKLHCFCSTKISVQALGLVRCSVTSYVFTVRSCEQLIQPPS